MKEPAKVVALEDDGVWVETQRQGTCNACSANKSCGQGMLNRLMPDRRHYVRALCDSETMRHITVGSPVEVSVPDEVVLQSSVTVYLMPLLLLLAGTLLGNQWSPGDPGAILGGLLGLLLGFLLVKWHALRHHNDPVLQPRVHQPVRQGPAADGRIAIPAAEGGAGDTVIIDRQV